MVNVRAELVIIERFLDPRLDWPHTQTFSILLTALHHDVSRTVMLVGCIQLPVRIRHRDVWLWFFKWCTKEWLAVLLHVKMSCCIVGTDLKNINNAIYVTGWCGSAMIRALALFSSITNLIIHNRLLSGDVE